MTKSGKLLLCISMLFVVLLSFTSFAYAEWNKAAEVTEDGVNLRAKPNTSADVLLRMTKGSDVNIISESDGWYNVSFGSKKGWISAQFVSVKTTTANKGRILAENVNLRNNPSTSAKIITRLSKGEEVNVIENSGDWFKVNTSANNVGWVNKDFISAKVSNVSRGETEAVTKKQIEVLPKVEAESKSSDSSKAQEIVEYAKKFLGVKYVYGGSSPKGFDCSGFTSYVFDNFSINLERVADSQAGQGKKVSKADLKAGDLVFFDTNGGHNHINHVGLYVGAGKFIHASSGRTTHRVVISDLTEGFYQNAFMTARRFLD